MLSNLSDIYGIQVGDTLLLGENTLITDIYSEALENDKWLDVQTHPVHGHYILTAIDPAVIRNVDITDHIINSGFHGLEDNSRMVVTVPGHINHNSLSSRFYLKVKGKKLAFFEDKLIITERINVINDKILLENFIEGETKIVGKTQLRNYRSTITALYKLATDNLIKIKIENKRTALHITHLGLYEEGDEVRSFTSLLTNWIDKLPYDVEVTLPSSFTEVKSNAYIHTVINKSKFDCKLKSGKVTKPSASLRKRSGKIEVMVKGRCIKVINKPSLTSIGTKERKLINLALMPHNIKYEDIR